MSDPDFSRISDGDLLQMEWRCAFARIHIAQGHPMPGDEERARIGKLADDELTRRGIDLRYT